METNWHRDKQTDRQTDRQTDQQTDRHGDRNRRKQTCRQIHSKAVKEKTDRQI